MNLTRRTVFDDLMLRDRMKDAVRSVVGSRRADELFPPSQAKIVIRKPPRYQRISEFAA